jgi:hypothetical protein
MLFVGAENTDNLHMMCSLKNAYISLPSNLATILVLDNFVFKRRTNILCIKNKATLTCVLHI